MNIGFLGTGHITSSVIEGIFKSKLKIKKIYISPRNKTIAKKLNKRFRNKNKHTDILSFPFNETINDFNEVYLGDIIISFNYMNKPKNLNTRKFKEKVTKIFIHGFLHLLGFDHNNDYYDNIYTDTDHYFSKDSKRENGWKAEYNNWNEQIVKVVEQHPALQFIWVNYRGDDLPQLPNLFSKDEKEI